MKKIKIVESSSRFGTSAFGKIEVELCHLEDGGYAIRLYRDRIESDVEVPSFVDFSETGKMIRTQISMTGEAFELLCELITESRGNHL